MYPIMRQPSFGFDSVTPNSPGKHGDFFTFNIGARSVGNAVGTQIVGNGVRNGVGNTVGNTVGDGIGNYTRSVGNGVGNQNVDNCKRNSFLDSEKGNPMKKEESFEFFRGVAQSFRWERSREAESKMS